MHPGAARSFPPDPAAVPAARRYVDDVLADWHLGGLSPVATLLVSELATNAVVHARTGFELRMRPTGTDGVRVELRDGSPTLPAKWTPNEWASHGRGLLIVEAMAERSGAVACDPGKVVWFELRGRGGA
jgi:hypothetical protein